MNVKLTHDTRRISILPLDILLTIMPFMAKHDQFSFMQTCRSVYRHGMGCFLRMCRIHNDSETLASFCRFVLQDPMRPQLIRVLVLDGLDLNCQNMQGSWAGEKRKFIAPTVLPSLERLFSQCRQVEELHIKDAEYLAQNDSIFASLSALRSLKVITFEDVHDKAANLLRCLRSPVVHAHIKISSEADETPVQTANETCLLLTGLRDTLHKLTIDDPRTSFTANGNHPFLYVHTLEVCGSQGGDCSLQAIAAVFPNLLNLTWRFWPFNTFEMTLGDIAYYRQESAKCNRHGWKLDMFKCCTQWAHLEAFEGPVRLWKCGALSSSDLPLFLATLNDVNTTHLDLDISSDSLTPLVLGDLFKDTTASVTHLRVHAWPTPRKGGQDLPPQTGLYVCVHLLAFMDSAHTLHMLQLHVIQITRELHHLELLEIRLPILGQIPALFSTSNYISMRKEFSALLGSKLFQVHHPVLRHILVSCEDPALGIPDELWRV